MPHNDAVAYGKTTLSHRIRSRFIQNVNSLTMHVLEAGFEAADRPCLLLLHGFPELAYSWRKVMIPLAQAGYHVVAPDLRGYGRTTGWDDNYDGDVGSFRMSNMVKDVLSLVYALGFRAVEAVVGHDFGSPVAAYCSLIRPDVFQSVVLMSAPFAGPPQLPFETANELSQSALSTGSDVHSKDIHSELATLPHPRKHYQWYYSTPEANPNMSRAPQGVHDFLRAYYHHKSADWKQNKPYPLEAWSATELAKLPTYYIMNLDQGMAETVAEEMPSPSEIAHCHWMPDEDLRVYSREYTRNGFQGGLQSYRCGTDPQYSADLQLFANRTIDVPATFIAGASDWGVYQKPGSFERMQGRVCTQMKGVHLVEGAGHWVQQEQPEKVWKLIVRFLQQS